MGWQEVGKKTDVTKKYRNKINKFVYYPFIALIDLYRIFVFLFFLFIHILYPMKTEEKEEKLIRKILHFTLNQQMYKKFSAHHRNLEDRAGEGDTKHAERLDPFSISRPRTMYIAFKYFHQYEGVMPKGILIIIIVTVTGPKEHEFLFCFKAVK